MHVKYCTIKLESCPLSGAIKRADQRHLVVYSDEHQRARLHVLSQPQRSIHLQAVSHEQVASDRLTAAVTSHTRSRALFSPF